MYHSLNRANRSTQFIAAPRAQTIDAPTGLISEVVYREDQPGMTQPLLLPLL